MTKTALSRLVMRRTAPPDQSTPTKEFDSKDVEISTDVERIDVAFVHAFLTESYWAAGRALDVVERSIRHSICYGLFQARRQIGFARVITDHVVFAYIADVFVERALRGRGLGQRLVGAVLEDLDRQGIPVVLLGTRDAHGLYEKFGFSRRIDRQRLSRFFAHSCEP